MNKHERVKKSTEFNNVIKNGKKYRNEFFTLFVLKKEDEEPRFGISVPTKTGHAVLRNRLKRQVRSLCDNNKLLFKKCNNYIIIVKDSCINHSFSDMNEAMLALIGEINEKEK